MARVLYCSKSKIWYGLGFLLLKPLNKVLLRFYSIENDKNKVRLGLKSIENVKIRYG